MQLIGSNERIFGNIPEQILHIGVIKEIKLLHSSKTLNHLQVVNVHVNITYICSHSATQCTTGKLSANYYH